MCTNVGDMGLLGLVRSCKELKVLNLNRTYLITDAGLEAIGTHAKKLTHLDLSCASEITDGGMQSLMSGCVKLRNLTLRYCVQLTDHTFKLMGVCADCQVVMKCSMPRRIHPS